MPDDPDAEMERRLAEHPELVARFKAGNLEALDELLEVCMGVKIRRQPITATSSEALLPETLAWIDSLPPNPAAWEKIKRLALPVEEPDITKEPS